MTTQSRIFQRIGGLGIVFTVLFVATFVLTGNQPGTSASTAKVVQFYRSHRAAETASVFLIALAAIAFTFFLGSLRRTLGRTTEGRQLAAIVTAGGAIYVGGLLLSAVFIFALVDSSHDQITGAAQTLNVLNSEDFVPVVVGLSIVALGTGLAALRSGALPRWLAWASVGLGILAIAGPLGGIAFLLAPVWTLATGIVLLRSPSVDQPSETLAAALHSQ